MFKEKRIAPGKNFATSAFIRYVHHCLLSHQYARASQGLQFLGSISNVSGPGYWRVSLACIHGLAGRDLDSESSQNLSFTEILKYYLKLLNSTNKTQERVSILIEILSFHITQIESLSEEDGIKRMQDAVFMMQSYLQAKEFQQNPLLLGYTGMLAFGIYCFYADKDGANGSSKPAPWLSFTDHAFIPNSEVTPIPSSLTRQWLTEANKLLRKCHACAPDSDFFVEFLIRALVAQAALETLLLNPNNHILSLKERHEWEEIQIILDGLERDSKGNPAVARLRFHVAWDLDGVFPAMFWVSEGVKLLQMDSAADFDQIFLPVISHLFESLNDLNLELCLNNLAKLVSIILDRIEVGCNSSVSSLWYYLAKSLIILRTLPRNIEGDALFELKEILLPRKFWWPSIYFQHSVQVSADPTQTFPIADIDGSVVECPKVMGFLRCVCARLLLFPSSEEYLFPGESVDVDFNKAPLLLQARQVEYLRRLYPDINVQIVY